MSAALAVVPAVFVASTLVDVSLAVVAVVLPLPLPLLLAPPHTIIVDKLSETKLMAVTD